MTTMPSGQTHIDSQVAGTEQRDQAFARIFRPNELVWQVGEHFDTTATTWRVDFIRQGPQGQWMLQRYKYDVATGVVYFMGERPLADGELRQLRRIGKVIHTARV